MATIITNCPDSLPWMIEWRVGKVVLTSLPRRAVESISSSGDTNADIVRPQIPMGCTGWRLPDEPEWRKMGELPKEWMPFLNRRDQVQE
jgi:hypothetical protein